ncbi:pterin-4-alpha-carbinolamine dehydratase 2, mitochondrial [Hevea brasiliensis]|uniref:pterin-4-alpha-carbinolamine dehydratase 2, mitochondrial n=1 Tax=Hevea brasiliensis TaxID=3981 RepID=UPI0025F7578A|nr:pterin-4-alpha-carbinolamine dehydratase 2, mitochondrial [Hevea brasiliensis]
MMLDLAAKKCVSCSSKDMQPMTEENATEMKPKVAGWNLVNEDGKLKLNRSWKVKSFTKGLELFQLVGNVAETEGIYPSFMLGNGAFLLWSMQVITGSSSCWMEQCEK